ncbi:Gfo/Idh/MocA family oxidoreductase [Leptospira sp. WS92.C1]
MKTIAVVGTGQLGSRHLQSLGKLDKDTILYAVDPNPETLHTAKKIYDQFRIDHSPELKLLTSLADLPQKIDLAIIACSSKERLEVIKSLVSNVEKIQYLILEKVLFPNLSDYEEADKIFQSFGIQVWVNCNKRSNSTLFSDFEKLYEGEGSLKFEVSGSDWGLACNSIHFLDFFTSLTKNRELTLNGSLLDRNIFSAKRPGYIEFSGTLFGETSNGDEIRIEDRKGMNLPFTISLRTPKLNWIIDMRSDSYEIQDGSGLRQIPIQYQSQLTAVIANDLFATGICRLPSFQENSYLHQKMLTVLIQHLNVIGFKDPKVQCPIT